MTKSRDIADSINRIDSSAADATAITIDANENVGVGTVSPTQPLEVIGSTRNTLTPSDSISAGMLLSNSANTISANLQLNTGGGLDFYTYESGGAGWERTLTLSNSGNVGVGTTSPSAKVTVSGTGVGAAIDWTNTTASTGRSYRWVSLNNGTGFAIEDLTDSVERMRIDASGNLLVGKTARATNTAGIELLGIGASVHSYAGQVILANRLTDDGPIMGFAKDGTTVGSIGSAGSGSRPYYSGNNVGISPYSGVIYPTDGAGLALDDSADIGASNYRFKDLYLGGGAYIGGTGSANRLDDYEEGTWTPTNNGDATGVILAGSVGQYTKIGRMVIVQCQIGVTTNFTANSIGGLPFLPRIQSGLSNVYGAFVVASNNTTTVFGSLNDSFQSVAFFSVPVLGGNHNLNTSDDPYRFYCVYETNA